MNIYLISNNKNLIYRLKNHKKIYTFIFIKKKLYFVDLNKA
jgi:hypothetical protein